MDELLEELKIAHRATAGEHRTIPQNLLCRVIQEVEYLSKSRDEYKAAMREARADADIFEKELIKRGPEMMRLYRIEDAAISWEDASIVGYDLRCRLLRKAVQDNPRPEPGS